MVNDLKTRFSLYLERSLWGHFWWKLDKINHFLKAFLCSFKWERSKIFSSNPKKTKKKVFKLNGSNTRKSHFYCTLRYHCSTHPLWKWSNLMFFWIVFDFFSNVNSCVYLDLFTLQIQLEKVGLVKHPKKRFSLYFARSL